MRGTIAINCYYQYLVTTIDYVYTSPRRLEIRWFGPLTEQACFPESSLRKNGFWVIPKLAYIKANPTHWAFWLSVIIDGSMDRGLFWGRRSFWIACRNIHPAKITVHHPSTDKSSMRLCARLSLSCSCWRSMPPRRCCGTPPSPSAPWVNVRI